MWGLRAGLPEPLGRPLPHPAYWALCFSNQTASFQKAGLGLRPFLDHPHHPRPSTSWVLSRKYITARWTAVEPLRLRS